MGQHFAENCEAPRRWLACWRSTHLPDLGRGSSCRPGCRWSRSPWWSPLRVDPARHRRCPVRRLPGAAPFDAPTSGAPARRLGGAARGLRAAHAPPAARRRAALHEPALPRVQPLPAAARAQPGELVPVGRRGVRRPRAGSAGRCCSRVGYSTCHWCHVMEEESFEDEEIARYPERALRRHQGRPRGAARRRRGLHERRAGADRRRRLADDGLAHAGPQAVLRRHLLPGARRRPRRRGLGFLTVLRTLATTYRRAARARRRGGERPCAEQVRANLEAGVRRRAIARTRRALQAAAASCRARSSIPSTAARAARRSSRATCRSASCCATTAAPATPDALRMATHTLEHMAAGGIYDHVGGGFHRYSTDARWLVPHFEKMLYDNALLALAYLEALSGDRPRTTSPTSRARSCATSTREMTSPGGRLLLGDRRRQPDADGRREEGWFFTWTPAEIEAVLGAGRRATRRRATTASRRRATSRGAASSTRRGRSPTSRAALGLEPGGACATAGDVAGARSTPPARDAAAAAARREDPRRVERAHDLRPRAGGARARRRRATRGRGGARPTFVLRDDAPRTAASGAAARTAAARHAAYLDDYAFLIAGLLDLYEATGDPRWLSRGDRARRGAGRALRGRGGRRLLHDQRRPRDAARAREARRTTAPSRRATRSRR